MTVTFAKMTASGNDFVVVDNREGAVPADVPGFARAVCRRRFSVGADGLLLIENSAVADFKMRVINPDGSEVAMCGNGARCVAAYALAQGIAGDEMSFETGAGVQSARVDGDRVTICLAEPHGLLGPFALDVGVAELEAWFVDTGVPHVVSFVEDIESVDVPELGSRIRYHGMFEPGGTNADFVRPGADGIAVRTYERGCEEETMACGTGAVASSIVSVFAGRLQAPPVSVTTRGGVVLDVDFRLEGAECRDVTLTGDARLVYEGGMVC